MKAIRLVRPDHPEIVEMPVPAIGPGEVLIRLRLCGICSGEVVPWYVARKIPYTPGHEPVGVVERVGAGVESPRPGDRVFFHHHVPCFRKDCPACARQDFVHCPEWKPNRLDPGGFAEFVRVGKEGLAEVVPLPADLSDEAGILVEPVACVVKSLRRGRIAPGEKMLVLGLGVMGVLHALLARARGVETDAFDPNPIRSRIAEDLGLRVVASPEKNAYDLVIVGPASQRALDAGFEAVRTGGRVLLFAPFEPGRPPEIAHDRIFFDEVEFLASYSCALPDVREAVDLLASGHIPSKGIVTHRFPVAKAPEAFALVRRGGEALKVAIEFGTT